MKILAIVLNNAVPELLLGEERLTNIRRLMNAGCYGQLESVVAADFNPNQEPTIWSQIARQGGRSILLGVPTCPASGVAEELIEYHVGVEPLDSDQLRTHDKDWLRTETFSRARQQFARARDLLETNDWAYFQVVEPGLDSIQRAFWREPGNSYDGVIRDFYQMLDEELGTLLERIDDNTAVLVCSEYGVRQVDAERDDYIPSQHGAFVHAVPGQPPRGEIEGARLIDLAPTLLELAGYDIPASMQGRSLAHVTGTVRPVQSEYFDFVDPSVEERLRGLGYLG